MIDDASPVAAYVECQGWGDEALAEELRAWCKERMRRCEHPHLVQFVDELSRMVTGRAHRYRLRGLADDPALA